MFKTKEESLPNSVNVVIANREYFLDRLDLYITVPFYPYKEIDHSLQRFSQHLGQYLLKLSLSGQPALHIIEKTFSLSDVKYIQQGFIFTLNVQQILSLLVSRKGCDLQPIERCTNPTVFRNYLIPYLMFLFHKLQYHVEVHLSLVDLRWSLIDGCNTYSDLYRYLIFQYYCRNPLRFRIAHLRSLFHKLQYLVEVHLSLVDLRQSLMDTRFDLYLYFTSQCHYRNPLRREPYLIGYSSLLFTHSQLHIETSHIKCNRDDIFKLKSKPCEYYSYIKAEPYNSKKDELIMFMNKLRPKSDEDKKNVVVRLMQRNLLNKNSNKPVLLCLANITETIISRCLQLNSLNRNYGNARNACLLLVETLHFNFSEGLLLFKLINYKQCMKIQNKNKMPISAFSIACVMDEMKHLNFSKLLDVVSVNTTTTATFVTNHTMRNSDGICNGDLDNTLKIEDLFQFRFLNNHNYSLTSFSFSDRLRRSLMNIIRHEFYQMLFLKIDIDNVNKGRMLYATPQLCNIDHFVIIISTSKGKAICFVPFYLAINISVNCNKIFQISQLSRRKKYVGYNWHNCRRGLTVSNSNLAIIIWHKLMHDIELNPGPAKKISMTIITLNCRGLGDIDKFRLLLNNITKIVKNSPSIIMLQETMILTDSYLKLAWRGKHIFTPGTGNSQGCITLLPASVDITNIEQLGTRGHCALVKGLIADSDRVLAVLNVYAPNGFRLEKQGFFENLFDKISNLNGDIIIGGDFNTTLSDYDRHNRGVSAAENRVANFILEKIDEFNLTDSWNNRGGFTWRRGQIMSKLDRIVYRLEQFVLLDNKIDWTITNSDHAAVIVTLEHCELNKNRNDHIKLDNAIIKNPVLLNEIRDYVANQLESAQHMNPHMKLEFAKMSIRTITLSIMKRERTREASELADINCDIATNTSLLTRSLPPAELRTITVELEELNQCRNQLLQQQGAKLAHHAKSRWYNEGEKSNKYFLNLLKRRTQTNEMSRLMVNGVLETDSNRIRQEVTNFYKTLYNSTDAIEHNEHMLRNMFAVTQDENDYMSKAITLDELWLNLKSTKATTPGPDGMSNIYLKKLWHIIGPLILSAWQYSLELGELPPSHKTSILRLIPKQGKDLTDIKNWRPITLSNCDHKLITRTYNARLLKVMSKYITPTQTAYIKTRNISDNLRTINAAVKLADLENDINGIIIALDAQKAFDSVNHEYIAAVLQKCALTQFIPLFKLLYKDLQNDIMINGKIGKGYKISNGVKQGDALSCSLFILAIEPVIRNIMQNDNIRPLRSNDLNYSWPKVLGYADDLTIITSNENECVREVFTEYETFTKSSRLKLNADKTEIFTINSTNMPPGPNYHNVVYLGQNHTLNALDSIKINGVHFHNDRQTMQEINLAIMTEKMNKHFTDWSRRSLSILGKIQIIKTFGLSQYLYTLAVLNLNPDHWKNIRKLIYKFIWNKNMNVAPAPHRISREVILTPVEKGGFGMVDLEAVMFASRIRRFAHLMEHNSHPIAELQNILMANDLLIATPIKNIEDVTSSVLSKLNHHYLQIISKVEDHNIETDQNLQRILLQSKIKHICIKNKLRSRDFATLTRRGIDTLQQALHRADNSLTLVLNIMNPTIQRHIRTICNLPANVLPLDRIISIYLYDDNKKNMVRAAQLHSRSIREILEPKKYLNVTKKLNITVDNSINIYNKIAHIRSVQSKTKLLWLIHGDVYCGSRLKKFKLSDNDRCHRCFAEETIDHLLLECPYTVEIWHKLGLQPTSLADILNRLDKVNIEIVSYLLNGLVFQKKVLPTEVMIRTTITSFSRGLCRNSKVTERAMNILRQVQTTGNWHFLPN